MAQKSGSSRARSSAHKPRAKSRQPSPKRSEDKLPRRLVILVVVVTVLFWLGQNLEQGQRWLEEWQHRPVPVQAAANARVGLISGHKGYDPGAVCPNGVIEQETVARIADLTAERLRRAGAQVDVLAEYAPELNGYEADALVSIHGDSCIERSGFKVARSATSVIPAAEDRLVACLTQAYAAATSLAFDANSITEDMTGYHAFKRVAPETPAAIIEVGFLGGDQEMLTQRPELPARGVAEGILCFLQDPAEP